MVVGSLGVWDSTMMVPTSRYLKKEPVGRGGVVELVPARGRRRLVGSLGLHRPLDVWSKEQIIATGRRSKEVTDYAD